MSTPAFTPEIGRTKNLASLVIDWDDVPVSLTRVEAARVVRVGISAIREAISMGQLRETRYGLTVSRISRYDLQCYHEGRDKAPVIVPLPVLMERIADDTRAAA